MPYRKDVEVRRICGCNGPYEVCDDCQWYPGNPRPPEPPEPPALPDPTPPSKPDPTPPSKPPPLDLSRPGNVGQYDMSSPFEPIKIVEHYNLNFSLGNVIKYVLRAGKKPGVADIEDLAKARQYLDFEISRRQANGEVNRG